jgi:valyl-tRNA synthetase
VTNLEAFEKPFHPDAVEPKLRAYWEEKKFYKGVRDPQKQPYTIVIPPPNVTGDLHFGHMLNNTLQDILIRWNRSLGKAVCWIPGTDHASIATEAKVTKMLSEKGVDKKAIGRQEFLKHAWEWKKEYGGRIVNALKTLGISCDWDREVFTMDEEYSNSVKKAFVQLYKDGYVYKGHRLVNWCPVSQSVISDEEVNNEERNGSLWHIRYVLEDNPNESLVVATTRPETLFGDLAIAVHPTDERYQKYIGKKVIVPVCNRAIPVIADTYVEKEFGTGVLKITPAHDMNDFEVGARHNLGLLNVMNPDASLNANAPEAYQGLDRFVARKKLVAEIDALKLLDKVTPHKLVIGISERGNVPIEYYLSEQWYIKMQHFADLALQATRTQKLNLHPPYNFKIWEHWLTNIKDWCVSRQLWWGHQIPIYTCNSCGTVHCEEHVPASCSKCGHSELEQDPNVLDTWASAWLWPLGVHNWANPTEEQKKDLDYFYPTACIITGADIIFFWIARMVMAGEYFTGKTPFKDVFFTPIVRDNLGRKMSKSLGNSPDLYEIIGQYGTDALRFSLINQIVPGQDIHWANQSCEIGRTFANKIWNASRFLLMNCDKYGVVPSAYDFDSLKSKPNDLIEGWIVSEFFDVVRKAHQGIANWDFAQYSSSVYEFAWMIYCDWFVELIKPRLNAEHDKELAIGTLQTACRVFDGLLRLLHPLMPYITEEVWQAIEPARNGQTIGFKPLPEPTSTFEDESVIREMRDVQSMVSAIRTVRGQFSIHPGIELKVSTRDKTQRFGKMVPMMESLARAQFSFGGEKPPFAAPIMVTGLPFYVDLEGLVDPEAERIRLNKKIEKLNQSIASTEKRLGNEEFVKSAPAHVVEGAQSQLAANRNERSVLLENLAMLGAKV